MHKRSRTIVLLTLLCLLALTPLLSGCGVADKAKEVAEAAKELATEAPGIIEGAATEVAEEPTEVAEEPTEEPGEEAETELQNTFDNLLHLAPVHMTSSWVRKVGEEVEASSSYEADLDANGNQHISLVSNDEPVELYLVDGTMYIEVEEGQFMGVGEIEDDAGFSFLALYGGAYLLAFNDLQDARLVGTEAVGPWQANKYEIQMDLGSFGVSGIAAGVQGAEWDYHGTAWVEPNSGALVKAVVDWRGKGADGDEVESWHSEFLASEGTVTEITAPENVLGMGG